MKLTPWFDNSVKPVREGVYEIRDAGFDGRNFRMWSGYKWGSTFGKEAIRHAWEDDNFWRFHGQDMTGWRGVQK